VTSGTTIKGWSMDKAAWVGNGFIQCSTAVGYAPVDAMVS
jgi:hypothetical protein